MIRPGEIPPDDSDFDDADDQMSQQDIHSNGLDDDYYSNTDDDNEDVDLEDLDQAYKASESAYTLFDDEDEDDDE